MDLGIPRADLATDIDAGAVRKPAIEDRHVGTKRGNPSSGLLGQSGLTDHLDVGLGLQQLPDAAAHDLVVVQQEHPDRVPGGGRCRFGHLIDGNGVRRPRIRVDRPRPAGPSSLFGDAGATAR